MAFAGISLAVSQIPLESQLDELRPRLHRRGNSPEREVWFLHYDRDPILPVWYEGVFSLIRWGSLQGKVRVWQCRQEDLEAGKWSHLQPIEVFIPATFGFDAGVWYAIRQGIQGILVQPRSGPAVYIKTMPSTHYYEVMCSHSDREPCFEGEVI